MKENNKSKVNLSNLRNTQGSPNLRVPQGVQVFLLGLLTSFGLLAGAFFPNSAYAYEVSVGTSSANVSIKLSPSSSSSDQQSSSQNVVVSGNCPYGHSLYVNAMETTDLVNTSDSSSRITTSSGTFNTPVTLTDNTWGVNTDGTEYYAGIPTASSATDGTLAPLASYKPGTNFATTTGSNTYTKNTAVYYSAKVSMSATPGTYTGDVVYTAIADESCLRYMLTVEAGDGGSGTPITEYQDHGSSVNLSTLATQATSDSNFNKEGYTLSGFKIAKATSNNADLDLSSLTTKEWATDQSPILDAELGTADSIILQAVWTPITYNLAYTCNVTPASSSTAGSGTVATRSNISYGGTVTLPSSGCALSGYTFSGWNTSETNAKNGLAEYALGQTVEDARFTSEDGGTKTLYAVYTTGGTGLTVTVNAGSNVSYAGVIGTSGNFNSGDTVTIGCTAPSAYACSFTVDSGGVTVTKTSATTGTFTMPDTNVTITATASIATISSLATMQEMNTDICSNSAIGENKVLTDVRDQETYRVNKLKDGKCWMVENLRIANKELDSTTSDLAVGTTFTVPASTPNEQFNATNAGTVARVAISTDATNSRAYGGYYNFVAATAGTGSGYNAGTINGTYSICPKGWTLPSRDNFMGLDRAFGYSGDNRSSGTAQWNASYANTNYSEGYPGFVLAGRYYTDYPSLYAAQVADYWSSTVASTTNAYNLYFSTGLTYLYPQLSYNKFLGFSVRCIAR